MSASRIREKWRRSLYRRISSILYRERCCARSRCTYGVRLLCLRHEAIVRNVFWSDPNLGNGSFHMARARYKRTRSTDNTIHVSGMADRRAACTFDIFRLLCLPSLLRFFSFCSPPIPQRLRCGNVCQRK